MMIGFSSHLNSLRHISSTFFTLQIESQWFFENTDLVSRCIGGTVRGGGRYWVRGASGRTF